VTGHLAGTGANRWDFSPPAREPAWDFKRRLSSRLAADLQGQKRLIHRWTSVAARKDKYHKINGL
jgi:hypothetical protein